MANLKASLRWFSLFIFPRYPFVNALTLLMLLGERATHEKFPPLDPKIIYTHLGLFLICGVCMAFNMRRKDAALIHAGQLLYMAYTMYVNNKFKYKEWFRLKIADRLVGVAGFMLLYAFFASPKPRQPSLRRIGEILVGVYLVAAAYIAIESKEDKAAFLKLVPGGEGSLYIYVMIVCACALCFLPGSWVHDICFFLMLALTAHTALVDAKLSYWTKKRGIEWWAQMRFVADNVFIVIGALMYISCTKKKIYKAPGDDDKKDS